MVFQRIATAGLCCTALLALAPAGAASSWTCHKGGLTRQVVVFYPDAPSPLPCRVFYSKPTEESMPRPLWNSLHEEGYCERQAAQFVEKLRAWGWQCAQDAGS